MISNLSCIGFLHNCMHETSTRRPVTIWCPTPCYHGFNVSNTINQTAATSAALKQNNGFLLNISTVNSIAKFNSKFRYDSVLKNITEKFPVLYFLLLSTGLRLKPYMCVAILLQILKDIKFIVSKNKIVVENIAKATNDLTSVIKRSPG